jgi:hypothetical protein
MLAGGIGEAVGAGLAAALEKTGTIKKSGSGLDGSVS